MRPRAAIIGTGQWGYLGEAGEGMRAKGLHISHTRDVF